MKIQVRLADPYLYKFSDHISYFRTKADLTAIDAKLQTLTTYALPSPTEYANLKVVYPAYANAGGTGYAPGVTPAVGAFWYYFNENLSGSTFTTNNTLR